MTDNPRDRAEEARQIIKERNIAMHKNMTDVLPWIDRMLAELQDLKAAHRADTKRLEADLNRVRKALRDCVETWRPLLADADLTAHENPAYLALLRADLILGDDAHD